MNRGAWRTRHKRAVSAISRNRCLVSKITLEPYGRKEVQIHFLMLKSWILIVNFSNTYKYFQTSFS